MKQDFAWDPRKSEANAQKHGVTFIEASSVFDDPMFITLFDEEHSEDEERYITIGLSDKNRLIMLAHTERENHIRIISARRATTNEEKFYQEKR